MNILLIIPTEYKSARWGGVMTYTLTLAETLIRLSHQVTILTPGEKNTHFLDNSATIHKIAYTQRSSLPLSLISRVLPELANRIKWMIEVYIFTKQHGPFDIIESPEWGSSTLLLSLSGSGNIVTRLHKSLLQHHKDNNLPITADLVLINWLEIWSILAASGTTAPTNYITKSHTLTMRLRALLRKPVAIIPNGIVIQNNKSYPRPRTPYILTVGRLEKGKGQLLLIEAFAIIADTIPSVNLILIGRDTISDTDKHTGGFKKNLEQKITKYHLQSRIFIKNQMTQQQLHPYYGRCLFYVAPSIGHENHPIALLDAIGWGKSVIGSNAGGIPEIISHDKNGLLFQSNDAKDLANKLKELLSNSMKRKHIETHNKTHRAAFDVQHTAQQTLNFYHFVRSI